MNTVESTLIRMISSVNKKLIKTLKLLKTLLNKSNLILK